MTRDEAIKTIGEMIHNNTLFLTYMKHNIPSYQLFGDLPMKYKHENEALIFARHILMSGTDDFVHCEYCKFWDKENVSCEGLAKCVTGESGLRYRSKNDFCSRGQRNGDKI
jgi:hypothetical protein